MRFVPYINVPLRKKLIDTHLAWMWENDIRPRVPAIMKNIHSGKEVQFPGWKESDIILDFKSTALVNYSCDDDYIYFGCTSAGRHIDVVVPYDCILGIKSHESHWIEGNTDSYDPYWLCFPMVLEQDLKAPVAEGGIHSFVPETMLKAPQRVEVEESAADRVKSVEDNVIHVQFGKGKK